MDRQDRAHAAYPILLEGEGRVLLAGEHLSYLTGWQAGAIESAWQQIARRSTEGQRMKILTMCTGDCLFDWPAQPRPRLPHPQTARPCSRKTAPPATRPTAAAFPARFRRWSPARS